MIELSVLGVALGLVIFMIFREKNIHKGKAPFVLKDTKKNLF